MLLCKSRQRHRCSSSLALCHRHFVCGFFATVFLATTFGVSASWYCRRQFRRLQQVGCCWALATLFNQSRTPVAPSLGIRQSRRHLPRFRERRPQHNQPVSRDRFAERHRTNTTSGRTRWELVFVLNHGAAVDPGNHLHSTQNELNLKLSYTLRY